MAENPTKRQWHFAIVFKATLEDIGIGEVIQEIIGGSVTVFLAIHFGFSQTIELRELLFLTLIGGIAGPIFGFIFRLVCVTPGKIYRELEIKLDEANAIIQKREEIRKEKDKLAYCMGLLTRHLKEIGEGGGIVNEQATREATDSLVHSLPLEFNQRMRILSAETKTSYSPFDAGFHVERIRAKIEEIRRMIIELN